MSQKPNEYGLDQWFSDVSQMFGGAVSSVANVKHEVERLVQDQVRLFGQKMAWISRDELEALRDEVVELRTRLDAMEGTAKPAAAKKAAPKPAAKKTTTPKS